MDELEAATVKLAEQGLRKQSDGKKLTYREAAAIKAVRNVREEEARWKLYEAIPKDHYKTMSGRTDKVLNEQAQRYGIPCGGKKINLPALLRAVHDFLADNKHRLRLGESDPRMRLETSKAELVAMQVREHRGELMDREQIRTAMNALGSILRRGNELIKRRGFNEAHDIMEESISEFVEALPRLLGGEDDEKEKTNGKHQSSNKRNRIAR